MKFYYCKQVKSIYKVIGINSYNTKLMKCEILVSLNSKVVWTTACPRTRDEIKSGFVFLGSDLSDTKIKTIMKLNKI